jgi:tetratricopeptide (TPR) repeat protein
MAEGDGNFTERPDRAPMDQFSAHLDRGWDLVHRGDLAGAQRSAEKSLEIDSESPEAHNLLGFVYAAQGDPEGALEHYRQAIALDDSFVEAMLNAAEVLIHPLHDFAAAIALVDDALEWAEGDDEIADALLLKFDAYMHQGNTDEARSLLKTLPEGPFATGRLDFLVGRAHFEAGELDVAREHLTRAIERDEESPDIHYYMGLLLDARADHEAATVEFLRCRELDGSVARPASALPQSQFERHVRHAIERLTEGQLAALDGALVVVTELPGAEVVADGVDPRASILLDALSPAGDAARAGRVFVYQRNVERLVDSVAKLEDELLRLLQTELSATFPSLAPPADTGGG